MDERIKFEKRIESLIIDYIDIYGIGEAWHLIKSILRTKEAETLKEIISRINFSEKSVS